MENIWIYRNWPLYRLLDKDCPNCLECLWHLPKPFAYGYYLIMCPLIVAWTPEYQSYVIVFKMKRYILNNFIYTFWCIMCLYKFLNCLIWYLLFKALTALLADDSKFGFIVMDGNCALFGTLSGNTREVLHKFLVDLPKKHGL